MIDSHGKRVYAGLCHDSHLPREQRRKIYCKHYLFHQAPTAFYYCCLSTQNCVVFKRVYVCIDIPETVDTDTVKNLWHQHIWQRITLISNKAIGQKYSTLYIKAMVNLLYFWVSQLSRNSMSPIMDIFQYFCPS